MPSPELFLKHKDWVTQKVKEGSIEAPYSFAVVGGGMCILNGESPEQIDDIAMSAPLRGFNDLEVKPLIDFYAQMEKVAKALKR